MGSGGRAAAAAGPTRSGRVPDAVAAALAVALSGYAVALTSGIDSAGYRHGGWAASIGVLLMTAPVAWARRAPLAAAACLGLGAPFNALAFGSAVRCGPALPAVFWVAACLGVPRWTWRTAAGGAFLALGLTAQSIDDPRLGLSVLPMLIAVAVAAGVIGWLVGSRITAVATLRRRNAALIDQRDRAAVLARAIERGRVAGQLSSTLRDALGHIEAVSAAGSANPDAHHDAELSTARAREAFADVEGTGRAALSAMRSVLQGLRDEAR